MAIMMIMMMMLLMGSTCVVKRTSGPVRQTSELISSSGTATSEFPASGSSHSSISEDLDTRDQLACIWRFLKWGRIDIGESESQIGDIEECPPEITKGLRYFVFVFVYA